MIELLWWQKSPSPFTLIFWGCLALYGAFKLESKSLKGWLRNFAISIFIVMIPVLIFDITWCIGQGLKFQSLHPNDYSWLISMFRDIIVLLYCIYEVTPFFRSKGFLNPKKLLNLDIYIPFFLAWFMWAPNPSWTDWTYAIRFNYGHILESFFISHILGKSLQGLIYYSLWK